MIPRYPEGRHKKLHWRISILVGLVFCGFILDQTIGLRHTFDRLFVRQKSAEVKMTIDVLGRKIETTFIVTEDRNGKRVVVRKSTVSNNFENL